MIYHVSRVLRLRDNDGEWVTAGDTVHFSYGMPPIGVDAKIIERGGTLIGLCPGHNPPEFKLRSLRRYVGSWYKKICASFPVTPDQGEDIAEVLMPCVYHDAALEI